MSRWPKVRLGEVLVQRKDIVLVDPTTEYPMAGVYSFGRGVFFRGVQLGQETSYKEFYRLQAGDLVLSRVKGWEGAVGVIPEDLDGHFVSKEFPVFSPRDDEELLPFLNCFFQSRAGRESLVRAAQGIGARRERVKEKEFLEIEVPVPPIATQLEIVRLIESLHGARGRYEGLRAEQEAELSAAVDSMIRRVSRTASWWPMGEVAPQVKRPVEIDPLEWYTEIGVRSFGKGTFQKDPVSGLSLGSKRVFRIHDRDVVFSNVFAWEGAIAVASQQDNGIIGSHRFMTVVPDRRALLPEFLCAYCLSRRGIADVRAASPGGAGRNRTLGQKKLAQIIVPVPPMSEQEKVVEVLNGGSQIRQLAGESSELFVLAASTFLESAFRDADT